MDPTEIKITAEPSSVDPESCKFTVDHPVFPGRSAYFGNPERSKGSPLIERLYAIEGVTTVLIADNTVTVTKHSAEEWMTLAKKIGAAIRAHVQTGQPAISEAVLASTPKEEDIKQQIQRVFDTEINPAVAMHGGQVSLIDVKGNVVYIQMGGGCQGCGMANVTLKQGIEVAIRRAVPDVGEILDVTDHAEGRNPYYAPSKK
ncbi:MAG: NifU family protein [Elusimicrobia bacterium]|nr:NifU family protein [Elusimicrobiota bacterium]